MTVSVVVADDHQVVRQGLQALLGQEPDIKIVGEASNGQEAIEEAIRNRPDVLVLDLALPDISGLVVTREVLRVSPHTKIVVYSMHSSDAHVLEALRAGALAYVLKGSPSVELVAGLRAAVAERRYLSTELSQRAIDAYGRDVPAEEGDAYETVSPREREVLELVVQGMANREIASLLSLSLRTVQAHQANLMRKLNFHSRVDLVRYALIKGILLPRN